MRSSLAAFAIVTVFAPGLACAEEGIAFATRLDLAGVTDETLRHDLAAFDGPAGAGATFRWEMRPAVSRAGEPIFEVTFPSPRPSGHAENDVVWCRFYPPRIEPGERAPAALVLHHMGGDFGAEAALADYLAKCGIAALEVEFPYYGPRRPSEKDVPKRLFEGEPEAVVAATRQAVADVRRAADWLLARPEIDPARIGCVGISLGGILGSLVAGADPRFTRNVLVIAGGDLATILLHESRETRRARRLFAERGWGRAEVEALVRPIEPLRFIGRARAAAENGGAPRILMLNAARDEVIPRPATEALREAAGRPEIVWYETGHATIAVFFTDLLARTREWFLAPAPLPAGAPAAAAARTAPEAARRARF